MPVICPSLHSPKWASCIPNTFRERLLLKNCFKEIKLNAASHRIQMQFFSLPLFRTAFCALHKIWAHIIMSAKPETSFRKSGPKLLFDHKFAINTYSRCQIVCVAASISHLSLPVVDKALLLTKENLTDRILEIVLSSEWLQSGP